MLYAFFLFWPANVIPIWLLCSLLQLFIPLNMFFRRCLGLKHFKTHMFAGFIIFVGVVLNIVDLITNLGDANQDKYFNYALLFLICSFLDVLSHALKESIVRNQPLNQERFNFRVSIAQFVVGICMTPIILSISR